VGCGFNPIEEVSAAHSDDHSMEEHDRTAILEVARSIGDPENGEVLFNAFQTEVNFACATCHRVDTTERLIGPGLLGVGNPEHDPSEHDMSTMDTSESDDHNEGETEGGMAMDHHGMDMGTSGGNDDHMMDMGSDMGDDPAAYIRESILHPSAFLVPGFPDNLMPKTYGEIFTDDEINDLVAYLMTLQ
jgi:mono/diheme cytochrome c family protein